MMSETPTIALWMGVPLSDLPREELEQALINTCKALEESRRAECDRSVAHIRDLAAMARWRNKSFIGRLLLS